MTESQSLPRLLFLCTGNSCRSQMAEAFARKYLAEQVQIFSAGTQPMGIHPRAVDVMREVGIDLSSHRSKGLEEVPRDVDFVVTLCGDAAENCPVFPANIQVEHWDLVDPAKATGTEDQILHVFRSVRDEIDRRVSMKASFWISGDHE